MALEAVGTPPQLVASLLAHSHRLKISSHQTEHTATASLGLAATLVVRAVRAETQALMTSGLTLWLSKKLR